MQPIKTRTSTPTTRMNITEINKNIGIKWLFQYECLTIVFDDETILPPN